MKYLRLLLPLLLLLTTCAARPDSWDSRGFNATVELLDKEGRTFCGGVIIDEVVLTAFHCALHSQPIFVRDEYSTWRSDFVDVEPGSDLAVLAPIDDRPLPKGVSLARKAPSYGDDIWLIGHPLGEFTHTLSKGIVSHPLRADGLFGGPWMQHDAAQISGNSGGPVLNRHGRLVGIVSFSMGVPALCVGTCLGQNFIPTSIHGAAHHNDIKSLLKRL